MTTIFFFKIQPFEQNFDINQNEFYAIHNLMIKFVVNAYDKKKWVYRWYPDWKFILAPSGTIHLRGIPFLFLTHRSLYMKLNVSKYNARRLKCPFFITEKNRKKGVNFKTNP